MNVQFDEPAGLSSRSPVSGKRSAFAAALIKMGLAKDERGAEIFLIGTAIAMIVVSVFLFWGTIASPPDYNPDSYKTVRPPS